MEIRQAKKEDYIKIVAMERLYMDLPWSLDTIQMAVDYDTVFFVVDDVKAYGSIKIIDDIAEINNICVDTNYRRSGYGSAVLKHMLEYANKKGVTKVLLEVADNNRPAIGLYVKFGFVPLYTRPNYYKEKSAIVMQLVLKGL